MKRKEAEETKGSVALSVWRRRSTILATSFVFAAAAFLALLLVGPRYEASVTLAFRDAAGRASLRPAVLAQGQSPAFSRDVAARLPDGAEPGGLQAFSQRIAGIVEGDTRAGETRARFDAGRLSVSPGQRAGEYRVLANAASPQEALALAQAGAAELSDRVTSTLRRSAAVADPAALEDGLRIVQDLQERLAAQPDVSAASDLAARLRAVDNSRREAEAALDLARAQGQALSQISRDPAGATDPDLVSDAELRAAILAYRALATSVENLTTTLPADSPRSRTARLRLTQLQAELAPQLGVASVQNRLEQGALVQRVEALEDEAGMLETELDTAQRSDAARATTERELASAVERYQTLVEADRPDEEVPVDTISQPAQRVPPPFWPVTALAALAGLITGTLGSAASVLLSYRRHARTAGTEEISSFDEHPEDLFPPDDLQAPSERTPDSAADAPQHDSMTMAEAVSAILSSQISRAIVVAGGETRQRSASLRLARTLAENGRLVLLVDLSPSQSAVREAGVPADTMGLSEVTAQMLGLSSVTVADEKSSLDLITSGTMRGEAAGRARAEALDYAARAYDHVLVDCGSMAASEISALADRTSAILLDASAQSSRPVAERLRELDAAGLDTALLTP